MGIRVFSVGDNGAFQTVNDCSNHQTRAVMLSSGLPGVASLEKRQMAKAMGAKTSVIIRPLTPNTSHNRQARG